MLRDKSLTYISLFSSAGVGCYGFHMEGFHCIATNELLPRRIEVQRANKKCRYETGYIPGDITQTEVKQQIYREIDRWAALGNDGVDVVIATPPCQGISVINHKKNDNDIHRNSLVVESVEIIQQIKPRFFIMENVMAFQKTLCIDQDGRALPIGDFIRESLGDDYIITGRILNFMNYGSNSSRTRTLMIGVHKKYRNTITPYDIYPAYRPEKTLRDVIYGFPSLEWGEICDSDFYHAFRTYKPEMREWIHDLKECESAFDNPDPKKRPHRVVNGEIVENTRKNRDKYTRQPWDRFIQCVHTRNDLLAAQNTIHPVEDRVFSIRELMEMMTIPKSFKWLDMSDEELNALSEKEKRAVYKAHEMNVRQCLGEAVPTEIMRQVAHNIRTCLARKHLESVDINKIIAQYSLDQKDNLFSFVEQNPEDLDVATLMRITELCNAKREENAAFYTNKFIVNEIMGRLPSFSKDTIRILEPSVGTGSFLPFLFKKYEGIPKVILDVVDIDEDSIAMLKLIMAKLTIPANFEIHIHCHDFLTLDFPYRFDLAVGNPPFSKLKLGDKKVIGYLQNNHNKRTSNLSEMFLEKCIRCSDCVALVLNKTILKNNTIQFSVENMEVLEYIALREKNAYNFLCAYIEKTLRDSGLWGSFERFFQAQDEVEYQRVKDRFAEFSIRYTKINTNVEAYRIFTKVLNILACKYRKRGTERGHISKSFITFDKIMYNQVNWRDELSGKDKNVARRDYVPAPSGDNGYYKYRVNRAIKKLRQFNDKYNRSRSEVTDTMAIGTSATHIHHIFPRSDFEEIADYLENLIALTSGQHLQKAHPEGNTQVVDRDFQYLCLICKTESIKKNILGTSGAPVIYSFDCFTHVLAVGLRKPVFEDLPENDFEAVLNHIEVCY